MKIAILWGQTSMKTSALLLMMLFALCLIPVSARGADIDGTWKGRREGIGMLEQYFTFKADGNKLSGTVSYPGGSDTKISKGKIRGNKVEFVVETTNIMVDVEITYKGVLEGDEIKLTRQEEMGPPRNAGYPHIGGSPTNPNLHSGSYDSNTNTKSPTSILILKRVKE
jgi:hypothetical protein